MPIALPDIPEVDRTPLFQQLLDIIRLQEDLIQQLEDRVQQLEDEIAHLTGLKPRPRIAPALSSHRRDHLATPTPSAPAPPSDPRPPD
jgi:hypothetical protein